MMKLLALALVALTSLAAAAPEDELLPPEKAFQLTTRLDGSVLEARWNIAAGYYLYRDKFKFQTLDTNLTLKEPQFPAAKVKRDPFFGQTSIYTGNVTVRIPFETSGAATQGRVRITAQGCNEPVGVCYPPLATDVSLALPAESSTAVPDKPYSALRNVAQTLGLGTENTEVVDPEKAFLVEAAAIDPSAIRVRFTIDDCCYLYRDKIHFSVAEVKSSVAGVRLSAYELPPGEVLTDEFFGRTQIYRRGLDVRLPLNGVTTASEFLLDVSYQGCSEKGVKICYPPTTRQLSVQLPAPGDAAVQTQPNIDAHGFLWAILGAFAGGLLLTFTPCVLPMIPILSGVIVGAEGARLTKLRGGLLSYTYVLGTAVTYTIAGAIAGATGEQLQAYFQNTWAISLFAAVLVLLALSMFGLYELQMPASVQTLLHRHSHTLHRKAKGRGTGEYVGVFLLGVISALIIGACVAPVLAFTLATAIATRDPWLGAAIMFALAHGQGAILVVIGISEGLLLPRAGPWMHTIKRIFGVLLIAVAIYLLGSLPQVPVLLLWAALLIACAVYLGATQSLPRDAGGWHYLRKAAGILLLVWGIVALLGGFLGGRDLLTPLPLDRLSEALPGATKQAGTDSLFKSIRSLRDLDAELALARQAKKPVILDYYATWCTDCVRMEASTFRDPQVRKTVTERFVAIQADVTSADDAEVSAIKQRFHVYGPPAMLFFDTDGQERRGLRVYGYKSTAEFLSILSQL